ncbi:MAG: alpha/beta hydrolase [Deltaproteobacteria bacterium]|nr:alpha/beta hydrolase [Deltaproteobacteria bacterium]
MSYLDNFHYTLSKDAHSKKLVFLHGLMGSGANWGRISREFRNTFQVLTYDQRGHGASFKPIAGYQPEDFADDLDGILDALMWDKVFLAGHSMGGRGALNFAHRFPGRIEKLVIEDVGPGTSASNIKKIENLLSLVPTPFPSKAAARHFFMAGEFESRLATNLNGKILGRYFYSNIVQTENGTADWRFSKEAMLKSIHAGFGTDRWHEVRELEVPTLIIRGEHSDYLTVDDFNRFKSASPMVKLKFPRSFS